MVRRDDLELHLIGIAGSDPVNSYASAIVVVPDAEAWHREFADGLREARGPGAAERHSSAAPSAAEVRRATATRHRCALLDRGLARHADAPAPHRVEAMIYRAELALRLNDHEHARRLLADVEQIQLSADDTAALAEPLRNADELRSQLTVG